MRGLRAAVAWGLLPAVAIATSDYTPMHKRHTYDPMFDDFSYLGLLAKRDVCSDAFGEDAERATCVPSMTLCCIRRSQSFPSCQQYIEKGWCCVGDSDDDSCYVDQRSACRDQNAVECANLQEGTERACCPKFTTCDPNLPASEDYVRCNINQGDLKSLHAASIAATQSTSSSSTSASETETETSSAEETPEPSDGVTQEGSEDGDSNNDSGGSSDGLSTGAIAGIAVGGAAVLALIGVAIWWFLRRKKQRTGGEYQAAEQAPPLSIPQFYEQQQMKQQYGQQQQQHMQGYHSGYSSPPQQEPSELMGNSVAVEMDGQSSVRRA